MKGRGGKIILRIVQKKKKKILPSKSFFLRFSQKLLFSFFIYPYFDSSFAFRNAFLRLNVLIFAILEINVKTFFFLRDARALKKPGPPVGPLLFVVPRSRSRSTRPVLPRQRDRKDRCRASRGRVAIASKYQTANQFRAISPRVQ